MGTNPALVVFSALYPPHAGGVETYVQSLSRALVRRGRRVVAVTMALGANPGLTDESGVEVLRLPCRPLLGGRYPVPHRDASYRAGWRWLAEQAICGVVVNTRFYLLSHDGLRFAHERHVRPVLIEHGSAHLTMGSPILDAGVRLVEHALTARCKRFPADCYAVSRKASAWLEHFGIPSRGELSNAIDADEFCALASGRDFRAELGVDEGDLLVAVVGRLVKEKGVESLAEACRKAREGGSPVSVVMAGTGPLESTLREREEGVHCAGGLARPDVAALLRQADVLCLPSRSEGFATALLEAAACGTPFIATDVGGARELAPDPSCGTVLPDASPRTVASALVRAERHRSELRTQGTKLARLVRKERTWDATALRVLAACKRANEDPAV